MRIGTMESAALIYVTVLFGLLLATPAFGYVDPNATGLITQILGPVLLVVATAFTFLRRQVGTAFRRLTNRNNPAE